MGVAGNKFFVMEDVIQVCKELVDQCLQSGNDLALTSIPLLETLEGKLNILPNEGIPFVNNHTKR